MAYGMKIADEYGNTAFDSSSQGGVFVQFAVFPPGQSGFIALFPSHDSAYWLEATEQFA